MKHGIDIAQEVEMMRSPDKWPHITLLPLKRRVQGQTFPEFGCLFCSLTKDKPEPIVYDNNVWHPAPLKEKKQYASLEALVEDGWVVD